MISKEVESEHLKYFFNIIFRSINENDLKEKLAGVNKSIDEFQRNHSYWVRSYGLSDEQCLRCLFVHNLFQHALVDCKDFTVLSTNFGKKVNFKNFYNYVQENSDDEDHFVVVNGRSMTYKDKLVDFDWVKKKVYTLAFFRALMNEGDLILLKKDQTHNQRLAVFIGRLKIKIF